MRPYEFFIELRENEYNYTLDGEYRGTLMAKNQAEARKKVAQYYRSWGYDFKILKVLRTEENDMAADLEPLWKYEARMRQESE